MRFDRDAVAWMPVGALSGFGLIAALSIGPLVWPFIIVASVWAYRRTQGRGAYGVLVGAGLLIAAICLPQGGFRALGLFGLGLTAIGVLACFTSHWGRATRTR